MSVPLAREHNWFKSAPKEGISIACLLAGPLWPVREAERHVPLVVPVQLPDDEDVAHQLQQVQDQEGGHGHLVKDGYLLLEFIFSFN